MIKYINGFDSADPTPVISSHIGPENKENAHIWKDLISYSPATHSTCILIPVPLKRTRSKMYLKQKKETAAYAADSDPGHSFYS